MILKRYWLALLLTAGVIGLPGGVPAVLDATTPGRLSTVGFDVPTMYVVTSPVSRILDAFTLLSTPQTVASLVTIAVVLLVWMATRPHRGRIRWWAPRIIAIVAGIAALEAAVALMPRPMLRLTVTDSAAVVFDVHSHTGTSHDVRKSYGPEHNREWHASGGFHAAWITDHVKFASAVAARANNPKRAGDGVSLLTGVEGRYHRIMSTLMLGIDERDTALLNKRGNLLRRTLARGTPPYTIIALPNRNLDSVTAQSLDSLERFAAIELIDAAPRGLGQFDREEKRIRDLAASRGLKLVAASNNHGYGRTVAAWNIVNIPGWKDLTPDQLAIAIEARLRAESPMIVMRNRPRTHDASLPMTLPTIVYQILGSLTLREQISWMLWIWGAVIFYRFIPHRRAVRRAGPELGNKSSA